MPAYAQPVPTRSRRWWPVVGVVAVVVVVAVGALLAVSLLRDGSGRSLDGTALPGAVTSEPEEEWTYDFPGSYLSSAVGVGDHVLLADEDGEVIALDSSGDEVWTDDEEYVAGLRSVPDDDDVVLAGGGEAAGVGAYSTEDGEQLWWEDDAYADAVREDGVLVVGYQEGSSTSELSWLDPETGEAAWTVDDALSYGVGTDAVYVADGDSLRRLDQGSGDEEWSVPLTVEDDEYVQLAVTDELVVAGASDEVTAYDADGGDELWDLSAADEDGDLSIGAFGPGRVYVAESVYDEELETSSNTVVVRDAEGEIGDIPVDDDSYFYGVAVESGGTSWFLDLDSGELYDEDVARTAQYDGSLTLTDRGVYAQEGSDLEFYEYGEGKAAWRLDLPSPEDDSLGVYAVDGGVVVAADGELTMYR